MNIRVSVLFALLLCFGFLVGSVAGLFSLLNLPQMLSVFLEEVLKACLLFAAFDYFALSGKKAKLESTAAGFFAGLGFGIAELVNYFISFYYHDLTLISLRLPPVLMHSLTGAILGYAIYAGRKNKWWLAAGLAVAFAIHLAFNMFA